jgi:tetratricopeptide (TPR) repeat protein
MATHDIGAPTDGYSVREVSDIVDISARQVRALVSDGAITPAIGDRGKFLFSFQDLVLLRSVGDLIRAGVAPHRVREAIAMLRDQIPDESSLAEVSLGASGSAVVVRVDTTTWEPVSGQTVLDLDAGAVADRIAVTVDSSEPAGAGHTATEWYAFADEIEASDPDAAADAYRRALAIDDAFADAHLNLGRLLHAAGSPAEGLEEYEAAKAIDTNDATTHFNIGVAHQDLGHADEAVTAYEEAIELAPRFADAHYNLSSLHEELGNEALAIQHLREYRDLLNSR